MILPAFLLTFVAGLVPMAFAIPWLGPVLKFFFTTRLGKGLGFTLLLVGVFLFGFWRGDAHGDAQAERRAAEAKLAAQAIDLSTLNGRLSTAQRTIEQLEGHAINSQTTIDKLREELRSRPLQSTKPDAKHEPNAYLDDQCNYTPLGRRRVRQ